MLSNQLTLELRDYIELHTAPQMMDVVFKDVAQEVPEQRASFSKAKPFLEETVSIPALAAEKQKIDDLSEYLEKQRNEAFRERLFLLIDRVGLTDPEVYKAAGIDRRHFSKIRSGKDYHPKKETVILLCFALQLRIDEAEALLALAGYSLSLGDTADLICRFFFEKGLYRVEDIDETLFEYGQKTLIRGA